MKQSNSHILFLFSRYLTRSFLLAVRHTKPDFIIFLGDLMNEGSASTEEEYQQFKERFNKIFDTSHLKAKVKINKD